MSAMRHFVTIREHVNVPAFLTMSVRKEEKN